MHLPDAVLSGPVVAVTSAAGAAGLAICLFKLRDEVRERATVLMGMMAAFVFAAQMVNFPVFPGVTGHLMGGVLSAVVLGPWAGAVVIATVLIVQALLFADGGITALGANFLNIGILGSVVGYAIYASLRRALGHGPRGILLGAMLAAWVSVLLSAAMCALELAASGRWSTLPALLGWMLLVHAAIGLAEALITGLLLQAILASRPDVIPELEPGSRRSLRSWGQLVVGGGAAALAVALFVAPFAWEDPDGLEFVEEKVGVAAGEAGPLVAAPMPDYQLPVRGLTSLRVATAAAGAVGTCLVFAVAAALSQALARRGQGPWEGKRSVTTAAEPGAA
jgi:cobalt/nickel transport system permease protein